MAELEILEALVSFFCPTSEAASTCREFIQNHSQILPPIGPLFYFLLFPLVFTILFILLLMDNVGVARDRSWGVKVLLGITAFIFIIISGWYPVMLMLSEFWYIIIILLGFVWFVRGHRSKKDGGGGEKGGMPGLGGAMGAIMSVKMERDEIKLARSSIDVANRLIDEIKHNKTQRSAENMREIEEALKAAQATVNTLLMNPLHASKAMELQKQINSLQQSAKKL